jgi:hypothetical protein
MWEKLLYIKEWLGRTFGYQVTHSSIESLTLVSLLAYPVTLFFCGSILFRGIYPLVFRSVFWGAGGAQRHRNR